MNTHLAKCPKVAINCKVCKRDLLQADLPKHTALEHEAEAKQHLIKQILDMSKAKSPPQEAPRPNLSNHNYFKPTLNRFQRKANLGTTSKYYCGGKL